MARYLRTLDGGLPGQPARDYNEGQWRRIVVESVASPPSYTDEDSLAASEDEAKPADRETLRRDLVFTSLGGRARAEQAISAGQRKLIDQLIDDAVNQHSPDERAHNTLYELLLPNSMKGRHPRDGQPAAGARLGRDTIPMGDAVDEELRGPDTAAVHASRDAAQALYPCLPGERHQRHGHEGAGHRRPARRQRTGAPARRPQRGARRRRCARRVRLHGDQPDRQ